MSNVIPFRKPEKTQSKKSEGESFEDIMAKNAANKKRMEEERKKANKKVKRSYDLD